MDGRCNHLAATLFAIEDHWNNVHCDIDSAVSQQQVTVPCTSQPCQWNLPKKIRSLRLHAAQAYSRHIFEHEINVKVQKFIKKCMLNTSGCLVILISQ